MPSWLIRLLIGIVTSEVAKKIAIEALRTIAKKSPQTWDDELFNKIFSEAKNL